MNAGCGTAQPMSSDRRYQVLGPITERAVVGLVDVVHPIQVRVTNHLVSNLDPRGNQRREIGQHEIRVALGRGFIELDDVTLEFSSVTEQFAHMLFGSPQQWRLEALRRCRRYSADALEH